jgi:hypothetical protein
MTPGWEGTGQAAGGIHGPWTVWEQRRNSGEKQLRQIPEFKTDDGPNAASVVGTCFAFAGKHLHVKASESKSEAGFLCAGHTRGICRRSRTARAGLPPGVRGSRLIRACECLMRRPAAEPASRYHIPLGALNSCQPQTTSIHSFALYCTPVAATGDSPEKPIVVVRIPSGRLKPRRSRSSPAIGGPAISIQSFGPSRPNHQYTLQEARSNQKAAHRNAIRVDQTTPGAASERSRARLPARIIHESTGLRTEVEKQRRTMIYRTLRG